MTGHVIYTVLQNGSDAVGISGLIGFLLFAALFSYLALMFRDLRRKEISVETQSARTNWLRTVMANHAVPIVTTLSLLSIAYALLVWTHYERDRDFLASGGFQSVSGSVDDYRATSVWRNGRARLLENAPGFAPPIHEKDRLVVGERTFVISCEKTPDTAAASPGDDGRCLDLHRGQQVKIDFVQLSPTQYRAEPLRIAVVP